MVGSVHHRLRMKIDEGGSAQIAAIVERTETEGLALVDADTDALVHWSGRIDEPHTAEVLADLAERR